MSKSEKSTTISFWNIIHTFKKAVRYGKEGRKKLYHNIFSPFPSYSKLNAFLRHPLLLHLHERLTTTLVKSIYVRCSLRPCLDIYKVIK